MLRYLVKRVLQSVVTLIVISIVTFLLFFVAPASPARIMCGKNCDANTIASVEHRLGIDQPITTQYVNYMKGIFVGRTYGEGDFARRCPAPCLGYSFRSDEPVTDTLKRTVPVTISIVAGAAVVWLLIGISLGMVSALRRGTLFDKVAMGSALTFASMQVYFLGLIFLLIFVYSTKIMNFPRWVPPTENPAAWFKSMILPWITLGLLNSAIYARLSRAQMLETLSEDYVRTARAKGLPKRRVYLKHALRAALTPMVTIAGLDIGAALGGTVITETVFNLQGLGRTAVDSAVIWNMPVVMATVLLAAFFIVVMNVLVDMLYAVIDPRVRLS
ncbi:MAG TPA: ABC transporter permease [Micromonosporaceae bacterium]|jgi:peptide/nickel transport system permease protein